MRQWMDTQSPSVIFTLGMFIGFVLTLIISSGFILETTMPLELLQDKRFILNETLYDIIPADSCLVFKRR